MKRTQVFKVIVLTALLVFSCLAAFAQEDILDNSKVLVVVPVANGTVDKSVLRRFDKLVPELRKISKDKIIKLECRYHGSPSREKDVMSAYQVAGKIEKYLREQHKLELDLWISIRLGSNGAKVVPTLTIAVFADDIKRLDSVEVKPSKPKADKVE